MFAGVSQPSGLRLRIVLINNSIRDNLLRDDLPLWDWYWLSCDASSTVNCKLYCKLRFNSYTRNINLSLIRPFTILTPIQIQNFIPIYYTFTKNYDHPYPGFTYKPSYCQFKDILVFQKLNCIWLYQQDEVI